MMSNSIPINLASCPLSFISGWGMPQGIWSPLIGELTTSQAPLLLRLPGHQGAPDLAHADLWAWADFCLSQAPEQSIWIGWSLGGLISIAAALHAPKRVAGLILVATTPRFTTAKDWKLAVSDSNFAKFKQELAENPDACLADFQTMMTHQDARQRATIKTLNTLQKIEPQPTALSLQQGLSLLENEDLRSRLPDIKCPSLWLFGKQDPLLPAALAERIAMLMPEAHTVIMPDAAHALQLSQPTQTAILIKQFLQKISAFA